MAGVGGPWLFAVVLPALLSSGVGALVFTGFGRWTGLSAGGPALILGVPSPRLDAGDVLWSVVPRNDLLRLIPYDRVGDPEDIAHAVVGPASDLMDHVVGTTLCVDGGMTIFPGFATGG